MLGEVARRAWRRTQLTEARGPAVGGVLLGRRRTSVPMIMPSLKDLAPVGTTKYSWKANLLPACEPPLITLKHGTGMISSLLPARSAKWR